MPLNRRPISWLDLVRIPLGVRFSFARLWKEIFYEVNLFEEAPRIDVPVFIFEGRYDEVHDGSDAEILQ